MNLTSLPSDILCAVLSYLTAYENAFLWETGDQKLRLLMKKGYGATFVLHVQTSITHRYLPPMIPAILSRFDQLVTLSITYADARAESFHVNWNLRILPPTIVHLHLRLSLFHILSAKPFGAEVLPYSDAYEFLDLDSILPRCRSLTLIETWGYVHDVLGMHERAERMATKVVKTLPRSLVHLHHSFYDRLVDPHHLPGSLNSIVLSDIAYGQLYSLTDQKLPINLEHLHLRSPYNNYKILNPPSTPESLENLKFNLRSLQSFISTSYIRFANFPFPPSLTRLTLLHYISEHSPLPVVFQSCRSLIHLDISLTYNDRELVSKTPLPPKLTHLKITDPRRNGVQEPTPPQWVVDFFGHLPRSLVFLWLPSWFTLSTPLIESLPQGLLEFHFPETSLMDWVIAKLPSNVFRVSCRWICFSGRLLPETLQGVISKSIVKLETEKVLERIRGPHFILNQSINASYYQEFKITSLPPLVTETLDFDTSTIPPENWPSSLMQLHIYNHSYALESIRLHIPHRLTRLYIGSDYRLPWQIFKHFPSTLSILRSGIVVFETEADFKDSATFALEQHRKSLEQGSTPQGKDASKGAVYHIKSAHDSLLRHHFPNLTLLDRQVPYFFDVKFFGCFDKEAFQGLHLRSLFDFGDSSTGSKDSRGSPSDSQSELTSALNSISFERGGVTDLMSFKHLTSFSATNFSHLVLPHLPSTLTFLDLKLMTSQLGLANFDRLRCLTALETLKLGCVPIGPYLKSTILPPSITHFALYGCPINLRSLSQSIIPQFDRLQTLQLLASIEFDAFLRWNPRALSFLPQSIQTVEFSCIDFCGSEHLAYVPSSLTRLIYHKRDYLNNDWRHIWLKELKDREQRGSNT